MEFEHVKHEPRESSLGGCGDPSLSGSTLVGYVKGVLSFKPAAPAFVEAFRDDPIAGRLHVFRSNMMLTNSETTELSERLVIEMPLTDVGGDCFSMTIYDWTLEPLWEEEVCTDELSTRSLEVSTTLLEPQLPSLGDSEPPPDPRLSESEAGCTLIPARSANAWWMPLLLVTVCWLRRQHNRRCPCGMTLGQDASCRAHNVHLATQRKIRPTEAVLCRAR